MPFSAAEGSPYVDSSVVPPAYYPPAMPRPSAPYAALAPRPVKEAGIAYILALLLGGIAAHRFYLGSIGGAIGYIVLLWLGVLLIPIGVGLFMVAAAGLWWFIDLFLIPGMTRDANSLPGRR